MTKHQLEQFLSSAPIARRAGIEPRVVVRRFEENTRSLARAAEGGTVTVTGASVCELVVGDTVLARGEIVETDGGRAFRVKEVVV